MTSRKLPLFLGAQLLIALAFFFAHYFALSVRFSTLAIGTAWIFGAVALLYAAGLMRSDGTVAVKNEGPTPDTLLWLSASALALLAALMPFSPEERADSRIVLTQWLHWAAFAAVLLGLRPGASSKGRSAGYLAAAAMAVVLAAGLYARWAAVARWPDPGIDVLPVLNEGSDVVLRGESPYAAVFAQTYEYKINDHFPYMPGIFLFTIPFRVLFGDVRWLMAASELFAAGLLGLWAWRSGDGPRKGHMRLLVAAMLVNPCSAYVVRYAWTEPLQIAVVFSASLALAAGRPRPGVAAAMCGVAISIKQYMVLLPFFLARDLLRRWRRMIWIALIPAATALPYALMDWQNMHYDLVTRILTWAPQPVKMTLYGAWFRTFGGPPPGWIFLCLIAAGLAACFPGGRGPLERLSKYAAFCLLMFALRIGHTNYYYFVFMMTFLLSALALMGEREAKAG